VLNIERTKKFKKDAKLMLKRGKPLAKLKYVVEQLATGNSLDAKYRDHYLSGNYANNRECHIEPDWLLIYTLEPGILRLERTGTHSDLFK
jgi:mRNA interferase YafQ